MTRKVIVSLAAMLLLFVVKASAQICGANVPTFIVDLTGSPDSTWLSPPTVRQDTCCGVVNPDRCVQFIVTLDPGSSGIAMDIPEGAGCGARPSGSLFYQINCGPPIAVGTPVCLSGVGPHTITFCKPGNNDNCYEIRSIPAPDASGDAVATDGCTAMLGTVGYDIPTIVWHSIPPNPVFESYLNCTIGCDTVIASAAPGAPAFVDYEVCGMPLGDCDTLPVCDTMRVSFVITLDVDIQPDSPAVCFGAGNTTIQAVVSGGAAPFTYTWTSGGSPVGTNVDTLAVGPGTYEVMVTDTLNCAVAFDTVVVTQFSFPIQALAGNDSAICAGTVANLNGAVVSASGGIWTGNGAFSPSTTDLIGQYTPTAGEVTAGFADLMLVTTGNLGCPPDTDFVRFNIVPYPTPVIAGPTTICEFLSANYSVTPAAGDTYNWTVTGGTISSGQGSNAIAVAWGGTGAGTVSVTQTNSTGCDSTVSINVVINPKPDPIITGPNSVCRFTSENYSVVATPGSSFSWSVNGGTISSGQGSNAISVAWGTQGAGLVSVTETNSFGCDTTVTMAIVINPTPVPVLAGPASVCSFTPGNYSVANLSFNTYVWVVNGGSIASGQGTNAINVNWGAAGAGSVSLTQTNSAGCDTTVTLNVVINPTPPAEITGPNPVCEFDAGQVYGSTVVAGATYAWGIFGGTIASGQGTSSISVDWSSSGGGNLTLLVTSAAGCDTSVAMPIVINPNPEPLVAGSVNVCAFTNEVYTTPGIAFNTYNWVVAGGTIAAGQGTNSITVNWGAAGPGSVSVVQTNAAGCDSLSALNVVINPTPQPVLAGPTAVCEFTNGNVYSTPAVAGHTFNWTVGGGTIASGQGTNSISVNWGAAGAGTVTLTQTAAAAAASCDTTVTLNVSIGPKPNPVIAGPTPVCQYDVDVYAVTNNAGNTYSWTATGGTISAGQGTNSATVQWGAAGNGTVSVTETNALGCDTTVTFNVVINPKPVPVLAGPTALCQFGTGNYLVANVAGNTYNWTVTGGTIASGQGSNSINVNWGAPGAGTVTLTQANAFGCDTTVSLNVLISPKPVAQISGANPVCEFDFNVPYTSPLNAGATYVWTTSGGTIASGQGTNTINVNWSASGPGNISLTVAFPTGCDTTVAFPVNINPNPEPLPVGNTNVCAFTNEVYTTPGIAFNTYNWTVSGGTIASGQGTNSITVAWGAAGAGTVSVLQTNSVGCDSLSSLNIVINPTPQPVIAGPAAVCEFTTGHVYTTPLVAGHTYNWSVAGGTIASGQATNSISVNWAAAGAGTVTLTQTAPALAGGCDTTITLNISIGPKPNPVIAGPTPVCQYDQDIYTVTNNPGNTYAWTATGGTVASGQGTNSANIQWGAAGNGTVSVTETNALGCDTTVTFNVVINPKPVPVMVGTNQPCAWGPAGYSVANVAANTYAWTVTGGTIASGQGTNAINVNWQAAGAGTVSLLQTNQFGCDTTITLNINILPNPVAAIVGTDTVCEYTFGVGFSTSPLLGATFAWTVNGGTIASGQGTNAISVDWSAAGLGTVSVLVTSPNGCDTTVSQNVVILPKPNPALVGPTTNCAFTSGIYSTPNVAGHSYNWVVTGGAISSGQGTNSINVAWAGAGAGTVTLTQSTPLGCDSTQSLNIVIHPTPQPVIAGPAVVCEFTTGHVYTTPLVAGHTYNWAVAGGSIASGQSTNSITVNWAAAGNGTVTLTQTAPPALGSCDTTITLNVVINPKPNPVITGPTTVCALAQGINYSVPAVAGDNYNWVVTGGNIASGQGSNSITVTWGAPGAGTVSVTQGNPFGCDTTVTVNVNILPQPTPSISGPTPICASDINVQYTTALVAGNSYLWQVAGGSIVSGQGSNTVTVNWGGVPGPATVTVTETHPLGCDSTVTFNIDLLPEPAPVITGPDAICAYNAIPYESNIDLDAIISWTVTGGVIDTGQGTNNILVTWNGPGTGTVSVTYAYANGCDSTVSLPINIQNAPIPILIGEDTVCQYQQNVYTTPAVAGVTYIWTPQGGQVLSGQGSPTATIQWNGAGNYTLQLYAVATSGCDTTMVVPITVLEGPLALIDPAELVICEPGEVTFNGTYSLGENGYIWNLGNGATSTQGVVTSGYWIPGVYNLSLTTTGVDQCRDTAYARLLVLPGPQAHFNVLPGLQFIADIDTAQFVNNSTQATQWLWDFGDGSTDTVFDPSHFYATPGTYTITLLVTDSLGCTDIYQQTITVIWDMNLFVPNAFTPNGDGLNDWFNVVHKNLVDFHLMIYSRWGELMFETYDKDFQWHGDYKGEPVQEGAYVWKIEAEFIGGTKGTRTGTVTLYR